MGRPRKTDWDALPHMLEAAHVARILGWPLHRVYYHARRGRLPCKTMGRSRYFPKAEIREWLGHRRSQLAKEA